MIRQDENTFLNQWELNEDQLQNIKNRKAFYWINMKIIIFY